jgi:lipopolysaccharide biosynthesis regulator YciM
VVEEFPSLALGHSYLAWVLSRVGRHREAIEHGRVAIQLSPESERVSILLFRVLWSAGESTQALDEMKRFMAIGHSDEYLSVMRELEQTGE